MPILHIRQGNTLAQQPFTGTPTLAQTLAQAGFALPQPCGGRGTCAKCAVRALMGEVGAPTAAETRAGVRLACQATLTGDCEVELLPPERWAAIESAESGAVALGAPMAGRFGAAIDLGTTTLAARVYNLQTGAVLGEHAVVNPQTAVAADVMGRISAALDGGLARLTDMAQQAVRNAVTGACAAAGIAGADALTVAGNTTMLYLLAGHSPVSLAHAPFQADRRFGQTVALGGVPAYLPPCAGAFMGADITCAALATALCEGDETVLLADIGTNGELMLWHGGKLYAASTAAGPAFEGGEISQGVGGVRGAIDRVWVENGALGVHTIGGAPAVGLCGSGLLDAVAALLQLGRVDATGAGDAATFPLAGTVGLSAGDVRAVQLAKAAIAAGMETLLAVAGAKPSQVKRLLLAGGFGSHLSVASAVGIGLIPAQLAGRSQAVGNASLTGASMLLLDTALRPKADWIAQNAQVVQLGGDAGFEARFMAALNFPVADE